MRIVNIPEKFLVRYLKRTVTKSEFNGECALELVTALKLNPGDLCKVQFAGNETLTVTHEGFTLTPATAPVTTFKMVQNAVGAAMRTTIRAVSGETVFVPPEVLTARQETCATCDKWDDKDRRCKMCGCYTDLKTKLAAEQCPHPAGPKWTTYDKPEKE